MKIIIYNALIDTNKLLMGITFTIFATLIVVYCDYKWGYMKDEE